jgi:hypothetical protein
LNSQKIFQKYGTYRLGWQVKNVRNFIQENTILCITSLCFLDKKKDDNISLF